MVLIELGIFLQFTIIFLSAHSAILHCYKINPFHWQLCKNALIYNLHKLLIAESWCTETLNGTNFVTDFISVLHIVSSLCWLNWLCVWQEVHSCVLILSSLYGWVSGQLHSLAVAYTVVISMQFTVRCSATTKIMDVINILI